MISALTALDRVLAERTTENALSSSVAGAGNATAQTSFADALAGLAGQTVSRLDHAEQVSLKALQGEADIREVVDAVMSAEQSLQAAIAIRDKIVTAYLELSRMAI